MVFKHEDLGQHSVWCALQKMQLNWIGCLAPSLAEPVGAEAQGTKKHAVLLAKHAPCSWCCLADFSN